VFNRRDREIELAALVCALVGLGVLTYLLVTDEDPELLLQRSIGGTISERPVAQRKSEPRPAPAR
jgi:hypothetical protein